MFLLHFVIAIIRYDTTGTKYDKNLFNVYQYWHANERVKHEGIYFLINFVNVSITNKITIIMFSSRGY